MQRYRDSYSGWLADTNWYWAGSGALYVAAPITWLRVGADLNWGCNRGCGTRQRHLGRLVPKRGRCNRNCDTGERADTSWYWKEEEAMCTGVGTIVVVRNR